jgi:hypothetical protein
MAEVNAAMAKSRKNNPPNKLPNDEFLDSPRDSLSNDPTVDDHYDSLTEQGHVTEAKTSNFLL